MHALLQLLAAHNAVYTNRSYLEDQVVNADSFQKQISARMTFATNQSANW